VGNCETCRFWLDLEPHGDGRRSCRRAEGSPGARFEIYAADEWGLEMRTDPDFGCVDWQEVGAGVPTHHRRSGFIGANGKAFGVHDASWPDPDYRIDSPAVLNRCVTPPQMRGYGLTVYAYVEVLDLEVLEQAWAETVDEAKQLFPV
jgi:hypothetical protein